MPGPLSMSQPDPLHEIEARCAAATGEAPYLSSYYFSFDATGCPEIDAVLSAVCRAGKAYHSTESWTDDWPEGSETQVQKIQRAAETGAATVSSMRADIPTLIKMVRDRDEALRVAREALGTLSKHPSGEEMHDSGHIDTCSHPACAALREIDALLKVEDGR